LESGQLNIWLIMWESGLVVKAVLVALIAASVVSWAIILRKKKLFALLSEGNNDFMDVYRGSNGLSDINQSCERLPFSPFKSLFSHGYAEFYKLKEANDGESLREHFSEFGMVSIERGLKKGALEVQAELESSMPTLASIGSISPFIGLFGTVWGIIDSFTGIAGGGATLDAVAPGIAEALVATAIGLVAAIPAVWFYNKYSGQMEHVQAEMDGFSQDFLNIIERSSIKK